MATISDPSNRVNTDEPQVKAPPRLAVGPLAWIRNNLFPSWMDTILTFVAAAVIFTVITSMVQWVIGGANWFIITFNLRQYMIGRYEPQAEWRLQLLLLFVAFAIGFNLATWARISRFLVIVLVVLLALAFILPPVIMAVTSQPHANFAASGVDIVSGSTTEPPQPQVGFIGAAGEKISIQLAHDLAVSDEALTGLYSFSDISSNLLRAAAENRLATQARIAEIERALAADLFTPRQREELTAELEGLEVPPPVVETYAIDQQTVDVQILDGATLEPLASAQLDSSSPPLELTLPASGWYVLDKRVTGDGAAILETSGIYPILVREFAAGDTGESGSSGGRVLEYVRMTDDFTTRAIRPTIDGDNVPATIIIDNQYRGTRPFSDYLRLFLAPMLNKINLALLLVLILGAAGYVGSQFLSRTFAPRIAQRVAIWSLTAIPILMFAMVYGIDGDGIIALGVWIFTITWIAFMYFYGMKLNSYWAALLFLVALGFRLVPHLVAGNLFAIMFWIGIGTLAAWLGSKRRDSTSPRTASLWLILTFLIALGGPILALFFDATNILPLTDTRRWGGLLLTLLLTIVGIAGSFPIGILLALGRRSSLPVVSTFCTVYIEFVRGVPLITVLFMSQLLVPLLNPTLAEVPNVFRAMIGILFFSAAYLAENVRGGLQSVPPGQEEAAKALGLNAAQVTLYITLPQALRAVIPALMGQCVSLFKDTSLVAIVGLLDLAGISETVVAQTEFIGLRRESFLFIAIIYFAFSYTMAYVSRRLEETGSGAARRI